VLKSDCKINLAFMDGLRKKPRPQNYNPTARPNVVRLKNKNFNAQPSSVKSVKPATANSKQKEIFSPTPKKKKKLNLKKIIFFIFSILLLLIFSIGGFFIYKLNLFSQKINSENHSSQKTSITETISDLSKLASDERIALKGEENNRINVLLLGMAGKGKAGGELTDTIMIASIDTQNNKVALLSLPRDLYVTVPEENYSAKINSLYKYGTSREEGIEPLEKTIEKITDLKINYYLIVNFSGFEKFIDDIGGINVEVQRDIYDAAYPGPNYSYEVFEIKKGFHKLDGATALKYARERHDDPEGDFGRAKRQQQVIQAAKNKIFSTQTFLNPFAVGKMLDTLGENIRTDITLEEIDGFIKLTKNLDTQNINNAVVDAWKPDSLLKVSHIFYGDTRAFILVPRVGNYSEIKELAENIFDLKILEKRKEEIKKEDANIGIIDLTSDYQTYSRVEKMLKNRLGFENIHKIKTTGDLNFNKSTLIDLSGSTTPFSLDELSKKVPASIEEDLNISDKINTEDSDYDIILVLAEDLEEIYQYEEDSMEDLQNSETNEEIFEDQ